MNEHEPTRQERREARQEKHRRFVPDNRRSVRLQAILATRPPKRKVRRK